MHACKRTLRPWQQRLLLLPPSSHSSMSTAAAAAARFRPDELMPHHKARGSKVRGMVGHRPSRVSLLAHVPAG